MTLCISVGFGDSIDIRYLGFLCQRIFPDKVFDSYRFYIQIFTIFALSLLHTVKKLYSQQLYIVKKR